MTPITPMGQLTRESTSPSASSVRSCSLPMGSSMAASCSKPRQTSFSLCSSKRSRLSAGAESPSFSAASMSFSFAAKMCPAFARSAAATDSSALSRTLLGAAAKAKLACLAALAISAAFISCLFINLLLNPLLHLRFVRAERIFTDDLFRLRQNQFAAVVAVLNGGSQRNRRHHV